MIFKTLPNIKYNPCKSVYVSNLRGGVTSLPQHKELQNFISDKKLTDIGYATPVQITNTDHDLIILTVTTRYISLDELDRAIIYHATKAKKYLYLAINKFCLYSTVDLVQSNTPFDENVILHCYNLVKSDFRLLKSSIKPNDNGMLGNFIHPVTNLFLGRHD